MGNQANLKYRINYQIDQSSFNKALKSLQDLQKTARQQSLSTGMTDELKQTIDLAQRVQLALKKAYNPKLGSTDITKFNAELDKQLGITVSLSDNLYNSFSKLGASGKNAFTDLQTSIKRVQVTAKESHKILDTMADTFIKTARWSLSSSVVHNFTNSIRQAYNYTKALDSSLNDIRIVTGKSTESMSKFAKEANKAAQQLGISTTAYTDASLIYYQQGLADSEVKARTEITAKVANVTRQSADKVSEQLTAIWNGYKVSAEEAEIYIDRLSAIAANSASNLEELATGMSKVASAAAALGVNENQLAAMLSTIESVTRQAPESVGTALRTVLARISDIEVGLDEDTTLGNYSAEMAKLGINVLDANNQLRNMGDVIEEIGGKWASMTREQQINLAQTMAGQRQYSNVVALFDNFDQYNKMIQVAEDSMGTLNKQQDIYLDRTTSKMQKLNAALEGVWDSLIDQNDVKSILDPLTKVANVIENIIDSIGGGRGAFKDLTALLMLLISRKASEGIGNFIINRSKEKQYQKDFEYKIQQDQEIIDSKNIDEDEKALARARITLHEKAPNMNKQEYDYHLKRIDEIAQATKEKRISDENVKAKDIEITEAQSKLKLAEEKKDATKEAMNEAASLFNKLTDEQEKNIKTIIKTRAEAVEKFKLFLIEQGYATREELEAITDYKQIIEEKDKILQQIKEKGSIGEKYLSGIKVTRESVKNGSIPIGSLVNLAKSELETFDNNMDILGASSQDKEKALQKKGVIKRAITQYNNIKRKHEEQWVEKAPSLDEKEKAELIEKQNKDFKKIQTMLTKAYSAMLDEIVKIAQRKAKGETGNQAKRAKRNADMLEKQFQHYNEAAEKMAEEMENLGLDVSKVTQQMMDGVTEVQKTKEAVDEAKEKVKKLKNEKKDLEGNSKRAETDRGTKTDIFYGGMSDKDKAEVSQKLIEIAGSYKLLQASASQAFNLISIGWDDSISGGQKFSQILTNLISTLGMAYPAVKKISSAIKDISKKGTFEVKKILDKNGKEKDVTLATNAYGKVMEIGPALGGAAAAIGASMVLYEGINTIRQASAKATLQAAEQERKYAEERKADAQTVLDSVNSLEELNKQYHEGIITKKQFVTQSEKIISANELEKYGIDELTSSYEANEKALHSLKVEKLNEQIDEQKWIVGSTDQLVASAQKRDASDSWYSTAFSLAGDTRAYTANDRLYIETSEGLGTGSYNEKSFDISSPQHFVKEYEAYLEDYHKMTAEQRQENRQLNIAIQESFNEKYHIMKKGLEQQKALIDQVSVQEALTQNLEVTDFQDYDALINDAVNKAKKHYQEDSDLEWSDEAKAQVIKEARNQFANNEQLMSYEGLKKYLDENTNLDRDSVIKYFNYLTSDQKDHFVDFISQNQINNAEHLKTIFEQIRDMDFTSEMARVNTVNLEELKSLAAEDYLLYKGIEEQVENGKNLSKTEYEKLNEEVQKFFTMSANGTYQFTGNVNEFKEAVRQFQTASTLDLRDQINNRINQLNALLQQARNFENGPEAYSDYIFDGKINDKEIDYSDKFQKDKLTKARVDYLAANGNEQGIIWKKAMENGLRLTPEEETQIAQIISATQKFIYDKAQQEAEELTQKLPQITTMLFRQLIPVDSDVDNGQLNNFTNMLQQVADAMDEFSDGLETNREAAELTAQALLRYNNAAQSWMKNYQSWSETLNSNNLIEFSKIAPQLRNVYSDLLGITGDDLSNKFLASKTNFAELQKALTGTEEEAEAAYNALMKLAAEDINAKFNFESQDLTELQTWVDEFNAYFDRNPLEARVNFNDTDALKGLEQFANKYGMTAQQIRDYALTNFGIDLEVNQVAPQKTTETIYGYNTEVTPVQVQGVLPNVGGTEEQNIIAGVDAKVVPTATQITSNVSSPARAVKVISGGKAVGGKTKYGMATPTSKKLSGSSSKSYSKKQNNKKPDIYHDVNTRLDQSKRRLQRTQDKESKLIGKDLVKNLNDQMILYRQQKNILEEKLKLQKQDLANQRKTLEQLGVQFDAYGNISNYVTILQTKNKTINELIARRNALINNGNEASQKQVDALDKQIAEEEASYSKYESLMNAYTTDNNSIEDTKDAIQEQLQKQIEIKIKKAKMKVEIQLDLHNAKKDWLNFVRNTVNRDSLLKTTNLEKIVKDAGLAVQLISDKFLKSSAEEVTKGIQEVVEAYNQMQATGTSDLFGNDYGKLQERLKQLVSQGMATYEDIAEATEMMEQAVLDAVNAVSEAFEEQGEKLQFLNNQYSKSIDLVKLLYGEKSYDAIMKFQNQQFETDLSLIDLYKKEAEDAKAEYEKAMAKKDTEKAKQWQQVWRQASENVISYTYEAAKKAQEARDTANEKAADAFEKILTGGEGFDYLTQRWNQIKEDSKEYLDTVNRAYQVSSVERKYKDAINGTASVKNQRELNKLMDAEMTKLKERDKLSKYDVERAVKMLDIKKAEMALQDARMSKTSMRLKRDSQGNYSYEYVADTSKINDAEQNLAKAKNDLYNFDLNHYQQIYDKILGVYKDYAQKIIEIENNTGLTEKQKQERKDELYKSTSERIKGYAQDYNTTTVNLTQSAVDSIEGIQAEQEKKWVEQHVPGMNAASQSVIDKLIGKEGSDEDSIKKAFEDLDKQVKANTKNYNDNLKAVEKQSGISFTNIEKGINPVAQAYQNVITDNDTLAKNIIDKYKEVEKQKTVFDAYLDKMNPVSEKLKTLMEQALALQQAIGKINTNALKSDDGKGSGKTGEKYSISKTPAPSIADITKTGGSGNTGNGDKSSLEDQLKGNTTKPKLEPTTETGTLKDILVSGGKAITAVVKASGADNAVKDFYNNLKNIAKSQSKSLVEDKKSNFKRKLQDIIDSKGTSYSDDREKLKKLYNQYSELFSTNGQKPKYDKNGISTNLTENWTPLLIRLADRYIIPHDPFDLRQVAAEEKNTSYPVQKTKQHLMNQNLSRKELKEKLSRLNINQDTKNILNTILNEDEKEWSYIGFNTGGYTGVWHTQQGKLAMLHEKELVLNKEDTENMLKMLEVSRAFSLETAINKYTSRLESLNSKNQMNDIARNVQRIRENLEQMVTIQASFPAVNSRLEIEEALKDLINITSQKIMSKK